MIEIKGKQVRTDVREMTLDEYNQFGIIVGNEKLTRNVRWLMLLKVLGDFDERELIDISIEEMQLFVDSLNESTFNLSELKNNLEIDVKGRVYSRSENISFYDISKVEEVRLEGGMWFAKAMAILYKDRELTNVEHYTPAHLKFKTSLFSTIPAIDFIPALGYLQSQIFATKETDDVIGEATEAMA